MGDDYAADGSGHENDFSRYHAPGTHASANRTWSYSVDDEYRVHTQQLETIAAALEQDLTELQSALQRVTSLPPITTQHVTMSRAGMEFASLADTAMTGFTQYYEELQAGYRAVIRRLYKSAGNYQKAEEYTESSVMSVDTGSPPPGNGPTTGSVRRF